MADTCSRLFWGSQLLLPDRAVVVYPDDVVAVQHTRDSGAFLHCLHGDASLSSPWRQSYVSLRRAEWGGWWEGGLTSPPQGGRWVDGAVCDLRMLYVDNLHGAAEHDDGFNRRETTAAAPDVWALTTGPAPRSPSGLRVVHPVPDEENRIHVQVDVPTLVVVEVPSGGKASSSWSAPVLRTGVPFLLSCPEEVAGCETRSGDAWFSSATLVLPAVGLRTLTIDVADAASPRSVSLSVCGYEAVAGLSVEPRGCRRTLVHTPQVRKHRLDGQITGRRSLNPNDFCNAPDFSPTHRKIMVLKGFFKRTLYEEPSPTGEPFFHLRHLYRFFEELFQEMVL